MEMYHLNDFLKHPSTLKNEELKWALNFLKCYNLKYLDIEVWLNY